MSEMLIQHLESLATTRILVVDDSPVARKLLLRELSRAGFSRVDEAPDGRLALELLREKCEVDPYELVLLDIEMPGLNGLDACEIICDDERLAETSVIIVTWRDDDEMLTLAYNAGALDYIHKPYRFTDLAWRVRTALRLKNEVRRAKGYARDLERTTELLEEANRLLLKSAGTDPLTGLANRRGLAVSLEEVRGRAAQDAGLVSVLMVDIDFFKKFNDTHGHQAGDECLIKIARVLETALAEGWARAARYGGEEFLVVLPGGAEEARELAERLRKDVRDIRLNGALNRGDGGGGGEGEGESRDAASVRVTISVGVAGGELSGEDSIDPIIDRADRALYRAKQTGRDRVVLYEA